MSYQVEPWSSCHGRGEYIDPQRRQWTLLAVEGGVQACLPHNPSRTVPLPAGVTITSAVQFLQFGQTVLLLRGTLDTLQMTSLNLGFTAVPAAEVDGLDSIPPARRGVVGGDRVWLVTPGDEIWASDIFDHTSYHPLNQFAVGNGAHAIVTLALYGEESIIVFLDAPKDAVYRLPNITQSGETGLLIYTKALLVPASRGCRAADSVQSVGADMLWLSQDGVESLVLTESGEIQSSSGVDRAPLFSAPIQPLIDRIRWDYASGAQGAFWDGKYYLAVPLDDATVTGQSLDMTGVNNAILVYDFKALQPAWQGHDEAAGTLFPKYFFVRPYNNRDRLFFINGDGWATLYEEGYEDALHRPYTDLVYNEDGVAPFAGNTLQVNAGTVVVTDVNAVENTATAWAVNDPDFNATNLWEDPYGNPGYATGGWSTPGATAVRLTEGDATIGVRFYSTSGKIVGVTTAGDAAWAYVYVYQFQPIETMVLSRGYATPARIERKSALQLQALVETWNPSYSLALKSEGVSEESGFVSGRTRSRTTYDRPAHRTAWVPSNVNADFNQPYRQDYSFDCNPGVKLGGGLALGLHQSAEHRTRASGRARAHQVRVTNTTGRLRLLALGYAGRLRERGNGIKS